MELNLKGKTAIVTGAGWGIGRATALTLAGEGAKVVVADMDAGRGRAVSDEIGALGGDALNTVTDITNWDDTKAMARTAVDRFGQIDILVNNAGAWRINSFMQMAREDWEFEIRTNYLGVLNCTRSVLDFMVARKTGAIVNVASDAGRVGEAIQPVYSGAKAGVIGFARALAKDVGRHGIRVNNVCPGLTQVERRVQAREALKSDPARLQAFDEQMEKAVKLYPLRKFGVPQDVANMIVFLVSDRAGHVTGQTISVSGGYTTV